MNTEEAYLERDGSRSKSGEVDESHKTFKDFKPPNCKWRNLKFDFISELCIHECGH